MSFASTRFDPTVVSHPRRRAQPAPTRWSTNRSHHAHAATGSQRTSNAVATRVARRADDDLRAGYRAALATNPDLKFGQYVAATRLSANLGASHPSITREAILAGLAKGDSIGRTLQNLGLSKSDAKDAEREAEQQDKASRRHNH
jgi:hypothetical protein